MSMEKEEVRTTSTFEKFWNACISGNLQIVAECTSNTKFIEAIASLRDEQGKSALYISYAHGHPEIAKLLIVKLLSIGQEDPIVDEKANTLMHLASYKDDHETIENLLQMGITPNKRNNLGNSPLHILAMKGFAKSAEVLLKSPYTDLNVRNKQEKTPFDVAVSRDKIPFAFLLKDAGARIDYSKDNCAFLRALVTAHDARVLFLLNRELSDDHLVQLLFVAIKAHYSFAIGTILKINPTLVNMQDAQENTALHIIAGLIHTIKEEKDLTKEDREDIEKREYEQIQLAESFIAHNAQPLQINKNGETLAHKAASANSKSFLEFLVQKGFPVDTINLQGNSPLMCALLQKNNQAALYLITQGAALGVQNDHGDTPLHIAIRHQNHHLVNQIVDAIPWYKKLLLLRKNKEGNSAIQEACSLGNTDIFNTVVRSSVVAKLFVLPIQKLLTNGAGDSTMHQAAYTGNLEILKEMNWPFTRNKIGNTPIHIAAQQGHLHAVIHLMHMLNQFPWNMYMKLPQYEIALFLNDFQETPLHLAVLARRWEVVRYFMGRDGRCVQHITQKDSQGKTPADLWQLMDPPEYIIKLFYENGNGELHPSAPLHEDDFFDITRLYDSSL